MGAFEKIKGRWKQAAGDLSDNPDLQREGRAQSDKGEAEQEAEEARAVARAKEAKADIHEAEQEAAEKSR
jgi:uncharacterized protein YjbJ (UPF0337 family)